MDMKMCLSECRQAGVYTLRCENGQQKIAVEVFGLPSLTKKFHVKHFFRILKRLYNLKV